MNYSAIVKDTIEYIEQNTGSELSLATLSDRFNISPFYFDRIFKILTGEPLMRYSRRRTLEQAAAQLLNSDHTILEVALDHGYNSHEAFTRSFKKQFSCTPKEFRQEKKESLLKGRTNIVERELKNYNSQIITDYQIVQLPEIVLTGKKITIPYTKEMIATKLPPFVKNFMKEVEEKTDKQITELYCVTLPGTTPDGMINHFSAIEINHNEKIKELTQLILPASSYLEIIYYGDMADCYETVLEDLCRIINSTGLQPKKETACLIEKYNKNYLINNEYKILLPIHTS